MYVNLLTNYIGSCPNVKILTLYWKDSKKQYNNDCSLTVNVIKLSFYAAPLSSFATLNIRQHITVTINFV